MEDDLPAIVIDNGSDTSKIGLAGEDAPRSFLPSLIGRPKSNTQELQTYLGNDAIAKDKDLDFSYPVKDGIIVSWEDIEALWRFSFDKELGLNPENQPILLTEPPLNLKLNREKTIHTLFETFNVPACYLSIPATLSCYSSGRTTAIVLDSGHHTTHAVPIYEGYALPHAIKKNDFAGAQITDFLHQLLLEDNNDLKDSDEAIIRSIKEKHCLIASDFYGKMQSYEKEVLPDGKEIDINIPRYKCAEALFRPLTCKLDNKELVGIHDLVYNAIQSVDIDLRREYYNMIVLSGGSTFFRGITDRLHWELMGLAPYDFSIKIIAPAERKFSSWIGGSILASLSTFQQMWITKEEYEEHGASIVHRKCF